MVFRLVHQGSDSEEDEGEGENKKVDFKAWNGTVYNRGSEIGDKKIYRVQVEYSLYPKGEGVHSIEYRRQIHKQLHEYSPKILNVLEKYEERRENKSNADIEYHEENDRVEKQEKRPRKGNSVYHAEKEEYQKSDAEIYQRLKIFRQKEKIFRHVYLGENGSIAKKTRHSLRGRLVKVGENEVAAEKVSRVMLHTAPEELSKNQAHNEEHKKRRKHAPAHTQNRTLIFFLKMALYQLLEEETVALEFLKHR